MSLGYISNPQNASLTKGDLARMNYAAQQITVPIDTHSRSSTKNKSGEDAQEGWFSVQFIQPNLPLLIAWATFVAFFAPTGWTPNSEFAALITPGKMLIIPFIFAYFAGFVTYGQRGALIASMTALGVTSHGSIPMIAPAIAFGTLSAFILYYIDRFSIWVGWKLRCDRLNAMFDRLYLVETLFALVFIASATLFTLFGFGIAPLFEWIVDGMSTASLSLSQAWLPISAIFLEPVKTLFGIEKLNALMLQASQDVNINYLVLSNPGPACGLLAALCVAGPRRIKGLLFPAFVLHFFGGVQEVTYLFVYMRPFTILGLMMGSFVGNAVFKLGNAGLTTYPALPSLYNLSHAMSGPDMVTIWLGILFSAIVSFFATFGILRTNWPRHLARCLQCFYPSK